MIFTSRTRNNTKREPIQTSPIVMNVFRPRTPMINPPYTRMLNPIKPSDGDRMKWGAPTWRLFHAIPESINDTNFMKHKDSIIRLIVTICGNLPCPSCSDHAKQYMNKVNFQAIQNRDDLKKMLFIFHNSVNERKGYAQFQYSDLDEKYQNLDFKQVVNEFMVHFKQKTYAPNLMAQQMYRQKQVEIVRQWFNDNITYFQ